MQSIVHFLCRSNSPLAHIAARAKGGLWGIRYESRKGQVVVGTRHSTSHIVVISVSLRLLHANVVQQIPIDVVADEERISIIFATSPSRTTSNKLVEKYCISRSGERFRIISSQMPTSHHCKDVLSPSFAKRLRHENNELLATR